MFSLGGYVVGAAALLGLWAWRVLSNDWFSAIILTVPLSWFAGRALVESGFGLPQAMRWLTLRRWQGLYFEHGSRHLRAVRRGDELLFFERDILAAIGRRASQETPYFNAAERVRLGRHDGYALTQAGCNRLLRKSAHPEARPLLLHLEREAFGPFDKRVEHERLSRSPPTGQEPGRADAPAATPPATPKRSDSAAR